MPINSIIKRNGEVVDIEYKEIEKRIFEMIDQYKLFLHDERYTKPQSHHANAIFAIVMGKLASYNITIIESSHIDDITIDIAYSYGYQHYDGFRFATCLYINNLHKRLRAEKRIYPDTYIESDECSFTDFMHRANHCYDPAVRKYSNSLLKDSLCKYAAQHIKQINETICYDRDYRFPYTGCKVIAGNYAMKSFTADERREIIESPQDAYMRIAIQLFSDWAFNDVATLYDYLSTGRIVMATPTILRSMTKKATLSSCNMMQVLDDIDSIAYTGYVQALISKGGGGVGLDVTPIRAKNSYIAGSNGLSGGPFPFIDIYESIARSVNQGGHRPGSVAVYLTLWHINVLELISCRNEFVDKTGDPKALTIFPGVFTFGLFNRRIASGGIWTLFCPSIVPDLVNKSGAEFERIYEHYEQLYADRNDSYVTRLPASDINMKLLKNRIGTGMPYSIDYDIARETHHQLYQMENDGFVLLYNLCTETALACNPRNREVTTCNLATVSIPRCVHYDSAADDFAWPAPRNQPLFDIKSASPNEPYLFEKYHSYNPINIVDEFDHVGMQPEIAAADTDIGAVRHMKIHCKPGTNIGTYIRLHDLGLSAYEAVCAVNRVIDTTDYAHEGCRIPSLRDRPIGIGQQGFADALILLGYNFDDPEVSRINALIQATIYYYGWLASCDLTTELNAEFQSYVGSPMEQGKLHKDILSEVIQRPEFSRRNVKQILAHCSAVDDAFNFDYLRTLMKRGTMNNHITSIQPTESSSKPDDNSEMCDPRKAPFYMIKNDKISVKIISLQLIHALNACKYDVDKVVECMEANQGSIMSSQDLPYEFRSLFRTVYEYDPTIFVWRAAEREPFIDMSQSTNIYYADGKIKDLAIVDNLAYALALRTRQYYAKVKTESSAIKATPMATNCLMCE